MWKKLRTLLVPLLFACYPLLAMYVHNVDVLAFGKVLRLLAGSALLGAAVSGVLHLVVRDRLRASLIATSLLIVFFSYGHVYDLLHRSLGAGVGRNAILLPLAVLVTIAAGVWIWKFLRNPGRLFAVSGAMIAVLYLMLVYPLARHFVAMQLVRSTSLGAATPSAAAAAGERPDIYYIILDGHGRQDVLQELYGYDDGEFIRFLEERGFFVASASHSNYAQTQLSLASSLNLDYLEAIGLPEDPALWSRSLFFDRIRHSQVRQILSEQGYQTLAFSNSFSSAITDADVYYDYAATNLREVELLFLSSTLMRVAIDRGWLLASDSQQLARHHYDEVRYTFETLQGVPSLPGDYFVFAHIIAPHPPFVFDPDGDFLYRPFSDGLEDGSHFEGTRDEYLAAYRDQVQYVDRAVEALIDALLADSDPAPIILLQGDHGPGAYLKWDSVEATNLDERMSILNAYYLPGAQARTCMPPSRRSTPSASS